MRRCPAAHTHVDATSSSTHERGCDLTDRLFSESDADFFNSTLIPIRSAFVTAIGWGTAEPELSAIVQLDVSKRPDVSDLNRVLRLEGTKPKQHPPYRYITSQDKEAMTMTFTFTDPVECVFSIYLPWHGHEALFQVLARHDRFYLITGEIENAPSEGVFWTIPPGEIKRAITTWEANARQS